MALELAGDVAIFGADEMQHLDDRPVARHRAAGRERRPRGRSRPTPGPARRCRPRPSPASSCACGRPRRGGRRGWRRRPARQPLAQAVEIGRAAGCDRDHDQARNRQVVEREAGAEPRLEQPRRTPPESVSRPRGPVSARRDRGRGATSASMSRPRRADLDGHLARDLRCHSPAAPRTSTTPAEREGGEEAHDGDHRAARGRRSSSPGRSASTVIAASARAPLKAPCAAASAGLPQRGSIPAERQVARLSHRHAAGHRAAPGGGRRTGSSARCRGWRSPPRCRSG